MERNKTIIKTSVYGIITNILLVTFKIIIGLLANSIAIILDAVNNLTDALSSTITIIGTFLSNKAPDKEHPYGHGRIEYFTAIIIGVIILIAGLLSLKESFINIIKPTYKNYTIYTLIIITIAIIVKLFLGNYFKKVGKNINSGSLIASGTDALFDSILSLGTLIVAIIYILFKINIEGIVGLIISIFIIKSSIELLKETTNELIGTRISSELAKKIKDRITSIEGVEGTYDLILHNYGPLYMLGAVHIEVKDTMTAQEIHKISKKIENMIFKEFGIIITIGIYASNTTDKTSKKIKEELERIITKHKEIIQLHGFYVNNQNKTIDFDIIIDFGTANKHKIKKQIIKEINQIYPNYKIYVTIDNNYSD